MEFNSQSEKLLNQIRDELFNQPVMSNLARPHYVERLIVHFLGAGWKHVGSDWSGWDIENELTKARIEVKQSAARQTWGNRADRLNKPTKPTFDIEERTGYYAEGGSVWKALPGRPADLYIFGWHDAFLPEETVDHRNPNQWKFYLLPETQLPTEQKTIALSKLIKLGAVECGCDELKEKVACMLDQIKILKTDNT